MANILRDAGWSTFWVGKNHNVPIDEWTMGAVEEELAARPGLRPLLRVHRRRDEQLVSEPGRGQPLHRPAVPARGRLPPVQGPRRPGAADDPRLQADRARQALVPVVLPGRQPRPAPRPDGVHRQVQGRVRRRLRGVPRVGAAADDRARHPARGHRADADQPDGRRHVQPDRRGAAVGLAERRREGDVLPDGRGLRRVLRVHRRPGRAHRRLPRGVGPARQHDHLLLRRQRRVGRGLAERLGQRGQDLRRLPRRPRAEPDDGRPARQPEHLQPLPDRVGGGVLDAVPDVQALRVPGRGVRPAGHPLAGRHHGQGRGAPPVPPLDRHRADDPRRVRRRRCPTSTTAPPRTRCRACRCATRSTPPTAPTTKHTQYYEMLGNRGIWHDGWKAVTEHGPMAGTRNFDDDRWQLFHTDEDRAEAHDLAGRAPREARGAEGAVVRGGRGQPRAAAQRPADHRQPEGLRDVRRDGVPRAGPAERPVHVLPGHERDPGALGGQRAQRVVQGAGRGRADAGHRGRHLRPRLAVRRPRPVRQGRPGHVRLQLPRHPARGPHLGAGADVRAAHHRRRVHQGADGRAPRGHRAAEALHRRPAGRPRPRSAP